MCCGCLCPSVYGCCVLHPMLVPSWPVSCHIGQPVNFLLLYLDLWWCWLLICQCRLWLQCQLLRLYVTGYSCCCMGCNCSALWGSKQPCHSLGGSGPLFLPQDTWNVSAQWPTSWGSKCIKVSHTMFWITFLYKPCNGIIVETNFW